jgi:hypothetical protein
VSMPLEAAVARQIETGYMYGLVECRVCTKSVSKGFWCAEGVRDALVDLGESTQKT